MSRAEEIRQKLEKAFSPSVLEVINESARHAGHAGADDDATGESHFRVVIRAKAFAPMGRLARHRAVHAALGRELVGAIHALALEISD